MQIASLSKERVQEIAVALSGWGTRITAAACGFFTFRQLFEVVGVDGVAGIAILQTIGGWLALLEAGTGYIAQNYITKGNVNHAGIKTGLMKLLFRPIYTAVIALVLFLCFHGVWYRFVTDGSAAQSLQSLPSLVTGISVFLIFSSIGGPAIRILYAEHKAMLANVLPAITSAATLGLILIFQKLKIHDFSLYVWLALVPPVLPSLVIVLIRICQGAKVNRPLAEPPAEPTPPWKAHVAYTIFNIASVLVLRVDIYVLSRVFSSEMLAGYLSLQKIYTLVFVGPQTLLSAAHPKFTALFSQGSLSKLRKLALQYSLLPSVVIVLSTLVLLVGDKRISALITAGHLDRFGGFAILAACLYYALRVWTDCWSTVLLATDNAKTLLLPTFIQGLLAAPLLLYFGRRFGISGAYVALAISFVLTTTWWAPSAAGFWRKKTF